jgi:IS30 family transposase
LTLEAPTEVHSKFTKTLAIGGDLKYSQLTYEERIRISILIQEGKSPTKIAEMIDRDRSTIHRELARNSSNQGYFPATADKVAHSRKIDASSIPRIGTDIQQWVKEKILLQWSPEQISKRMEVELDEKVSHEWIYQLIEQDRKEGGQLYLHLRWGRRKRKKRFGGRDKRGQIPNRVSIELRPEVINQRGRLGDLEGDTVIGKNHKGKLLTLVDRKSRLTIIEKLENKSAEVTGAAVTHRVSAFEAPFLSITFDNGKEFSHHEKITEETGIPIFFAHPYSSYERGTNENTNGLIRQYFPKACDLSQVDESRVKEVESLLNHRPRKVLGFKTPYEVHFNQSVQYFSSAPSG